MTAHRRPLRMCRAMGCTLARPCPRHDTGHTSGGTRHQRGYGARWVRFRDWYFAELWRLRVPRAGLCGSRLPHAPVTLDSECAKQGRPVLATVLDHISPVSGPDDPRFYDPQALQVLCESCHNAKRNRERA